MYTYKYMIVHKYPYVHMYVSVAVCLAVCMYVYTCVRVLESHLISKTEYVCINIYVHIYICMYTCVANCNGPTKNEFGELKVGLAPACGDTEHSSAKGILPLFGSDLSSPRDHGYDKNADLGNSIPKRSEEKKRRECVGGAGGGIEETIQRDWELVSLTGTNQPDLGLVQVHQ